MRKALVAFFCNIPNDRVEFLRVSEYWQMVNNAIAIGNWQCGGSSLEGMVGDEGSEYYQAKLEEVRKDFENAPKKN